MSDEPAGDLVRVREVRERTIELLSSYYANDVLDIYEFERRVERAEEATTVAALDELVADLGPAPEALAPVEDERDTERPVALVRAEDVDDERSLVSFFGGTTRKGVWTAPRKLKVWTVFGGSDLDFREARLAPGVNVVKVFTMFGGTDIIVPPDMRVEVDGAGIFGGFDGSNSAGEVGEPDPDAPSLLVQGVAVFGGVDVEERYRGETARQARKRRRRERKQLARQQRAELRAREKRAKRLGPKK